MDINLYSMTSERERIIKTLGTPLELTGSLRGESSVINPSFLVEATNISGYNYCYISEFGRYYFITNITSVRTNLWRIDCTVDVLMTYSSEILNINVIINHDSLPDEERYVNGEQWVTTVKTKTDVINFPTGLLNDGEYILITSGGIAT